MTPIESAAIAVFESRATHAEWWILDDLWKVDQGHVKKLLHRVATDIYPRSNGTDIKKKVDDVTSLLCVAILGLDEINVPAQGSHDNWTICASSFEEDAKRIEHDVSHALVAVWSKKGVWYRTKCHGYILRKADTGVADYNGLYHFTFECGNHETHRCTGEDWAHVRVTI